jgi:heptaprenylglycerol acetyltransferase
VRRRNPYRDPALRGIKNRLFQVIALYAPGAMTTRVRLHRARGVHIGTGVFIGTAALIETSRPELVSIGSNVAIGIRSVIIAHFREMIKGSEETSGISVRIEDDVFIGPGVIILPNVTIGRGAVVTAGSVVARSVPELTMVQGNPARPVAHCGIPLGMKTPLKEFLRALQPIR